VETKETRKVVAKIKRSTRIKKVVKVSRVLEFITLIYFMLVVAAAIVWQQNIKLPSGLWFISSNSPLLTLPSIILLFVIADITLFMLTLTRYEIKKQSGEGIKEDKLASAVETTVCNLLNLPSTNSLVKTADAGSDE